jgi:hypothetical protein
VPNESKQMLITRPSLLCEPNLDQPFTRSGPPHAPLYGLMTVFQFRPQRGRDGRCVSYVVFSGLGFSRNIIPLISLTPAGAKGSSSLQIIAKESASADCAVQKDLNCYDRESSVYNLSSSSHRMATILRKSTFGPPDTSHVRTKNLSE